MVARGCDHPRGENRGTAPCGENHGTARLTRDGVQVQAIKASHEARIEAGIMGAGVPLRTLSCSVVNEEVLATRAQVLSTRCNRMRQTATDGSADPCAQSRGPRDSRAS